ncbi:hypothetical protein H9P43_006015 [Blastocladiella emersonii ATCC 22665]|nr:hypothetical protein H9P43_006015 [Blastocladiella emersonii ATCC 22665]
MSDPNQASVALLMGQLLNLDRQLDNLVKTMAQIRGLHGAEAGANYASLLEGLQHAAAQLSGLAMAMHKKMADFVVLPFAIDNPAGDVAPEWLKVVPELPLEVVAADAQLVETERVQLQQMVARDAANAQQGGSSSGPAAKRRNVRGGLLAARRNAADTASAADPTKDDATMFAKLQAKVRFHDDILNKAQTYLTDQFAAKEHKLFRPYQEVDDFDVDDAATGFVAGEDAGGQRRMHASRLNRVSTVQAAMSLAAMHAGSAPPPVVPPDAANRLREIVRFMHGGPPM